jgi:hypothetical protein
LQRNPWSPNGIGLRPNGQGTLPNGRTERRSLIAQPLISAGRTGRNAFTDKRFRRLIAENLGSVEKACATDRRDTTPLASVCATDWARAANWPDSVIRLATSILVTPVRNHRYGSAIYRRMISSVGRTLHSGTKRYKPQPLDLSCSSPPSVFMAPFWGRVNCFFDSRSVIREGNLRNTRLTKGWLGCYCVTCPRESNRELLVAQKGLTA